MAKSRVLVGQEGEESQFKVEPVLRPRQQVERQIQNAILSGVFRQGDRLPSELRLAEQFSVSRATVREALRSLAEKGLLKKTPGAGGGSFVECFDHHSIGDVLHDRLNSTLELGSISYEEVSMFRNLLELPTARLAALSRTERDLDDLKAIIRLEKALSVRDPEVQELNARFHSVLARASGNRLLDAFVTALHRVTRPLTFIDTTQDVGRHAVRHHISIVNAVEEGDAVLAEKAMRDHLEYLRMHAAF